MTRPTTPYNQRGFHRVDPATSRMARNFTISDWKIRNWPITDWRIHHLSAYADFWLRSAVGERGMWSGGWREAFSASQPERNAAAEPQTEARRCCCGKLPMPACDERAVCVVERAWSRGRQGRPSARGAQQAARWSQRNRRKVINKHGSWSKPAFDSTIQ